MEAADRSLIVSGLTKRFSAADGEVTAVAGVDFEVAPGEFFTMLGPSGCGKTTTLRMIAGLEPPSSGSIRFEGRDFSDIPAQDRQIGMVFQSYALFPHLTVFENVAYGLRLRKATAGEIAARVGEVLRMLRLELLADRIPSRLSGGQQQRVSIARALVYRPRLLLLDEPLANLDAKLRVQMRDEIRSLQKRLAVMTLYVTHDQEEAMAVSDRIAVFDRGRLAQIGRPRDIYHEPASLFVADFIGKANFFPVAIVSRSGTRLTVSLPGGATIEITRTRREPTPIDAAARPARGEALVMVRPERMRLLSDGGLVPGRVQLIQHLGSFVRYTLAVPDMPAPATVEVSREIAGIEEGHDCRIDFVPEDGILYADA